MRQAAAFGPICPQAPDPQRAPIERQSEDCLTLNVWAPAVTTKPAPVLVWIHGGGDDVGSASRPEFDGAPFARDGVVFVSIEYRLGPLGWFAHPALTREAKPGEPLANYGLLDEIAALAWVKRNIAAFGGDPGRVTVAGESAGGEAVQALMTMPAARGLFEQAIVESGVGWVRHPDLAHAESAGAGVARKAGLPDGADAAALRALPLNAIMSAAVGAESGIILDGRWVKEDSQRAFARGAAPPMPLLIGSNSGEDNLTGGDAAFIQRQITDLPPATQAALRTAYGAEAGDDDALGRAIFRDRDMAAPAHWIAGQAAAAGAPVFLYRFGYVPQMRRLRQQKAGHGSEMLFVFESLDRAPVPLRVIADADRAEMAMVHQCWVTFVLSGRPSCAGAPDWPVYARASDALMDFGLDAASVRSGFDRPAYDILEGLEADQLKPR